MDKKIAILGTGANGSSVAADLIQAAEDVKTTIGKDAIADLLANGKLQRNGEGKKNSAFRYWAPRFIESEPPIVPTESIVEPTPPQDGEQPEFIESLIRDVVSTESINGRPKAGEDHEEGQFGGPEESSGIHSVGTPTLYTTETNKAGEVEV